jgi:DeoR family ulaG and ulaABCDEF operon transcriptional repressor
VVLADSSKFRSRSSLILCPLDRITTVITDEGIPDSAVQMLEQAGVQVIAAPVEAAQASAAGGG